MEKGKNTNRGKKWVWVVLGVLLLLVLICSLGGDNGGNQQNSDSSEGDVKNLIENECTDAKYGINDGFNPISVTNYNFDMYEYSFTDKGDPIYLATWNGKDKETGDQVVFQCYASNNNGSVTVFYIKAGETDIWKGQSDIDYSSYNKDGSPMYPELH